LSFGCDFYWVGIALVLATAQIHTVVQFNWGFEVQRFAE